MFFFVFCAPLGPVNLSVASNPRRDIFDLDVYPCCGVPGT